MIVQYDVQVQNQGKKSMSLMIKGHSLTEVRSLTINSLILF